MLKDTPKGNKYMQLDFFINRIGKRIYRDDVSCDCQTCKFITKHGLIVTDKQHAEYLYIISNELNINYRD